MSNVWIDPEGRDYSVYSHYDFIVDEASKGNEDVLKFFTPKERAQEDQSGTVYSIADRMLQAGWIRVTSDTTYRGRLGIEGRFDRLRRESRLLEDLIGASGASTIDIGLIRAGKEDLLLTVTYYAVIDDGLVKAMQMDRMQQGIAASELNRREQVFVRSHGRKVGVYEGGKYYRERKMSPSKCTPGSSRTIDIARGHKAVICRPRGSKKTRVQSLLHPRNERERKKLGLPKASRREKERPDYIFVPELGQFVKVPPEPHGLEMRTTTTYEPASVAEERRRRRR